MPVFPGNKREKNHLRAQLAELDCDCLREENSKLKAYLVLLRPLEEAARKHQSELKKLASFPKRADLSDTEYESLKATFLENAGRTLDKLSLAAFHLLERDLDGMGYFRIELLENETWRETAGRYARPWLRENEVLKMYDKIYAGGEVSEEEACRTACSEWDVIPLKEV